MIKYLDYLACTFFAVLRLRHNIITLRGAYSRYLLRLMWMGCLESELVRICSDKHAVKEKVAEFTGNKNACPKTIQVVAKVEDIDCELLATPSVIKPAHSSGRILFLPQAYEYVRPCVAEWLRHDYYKLWRQRNYSDIIPTVIQEELVFGTQNATDYKFFCFDGEPAFIQVDFNRFEDHQRCNYSLSWEKLDFCIGYPVSKSGIAKPRILPELIQIARAIGRHFRHVRVDFYVSSEDYRIGELTFFHGGAGERCFGNAKSMAGLLPQK